MATDALLGFALMGMSYQAAHASQGSGDGASGRRAFFERLTEQIGHELGASHQYVAVAVFYDAQTLPRLAAFFYRQALEERDHAMMMVRYLLDAGREVVLPGVRAPTSSFEDIVAPVEIGLEQEHRVTDQISALAGLARQEGDYQSEHFMGWFLKEQVEEVATMSDLLAVARRCRENPMLIEDYLAREAAGEEGADPTAPPVAGGFAT